MVSDTKTKERTLKSADFKTDVHNDWCPGCGDFGILNSVQMALADLAIEPWRVVCVSGIGCSGKTTEYVNTYGCHTLHGRVLPFAIGMKLANPDLEVVALGGDGDGYGIGAGHFLNAGRRNVDLAYVVFNNEVYGLTKGQASPTLRRGEQTKSLPLPNINEGINPLTIALSAGYTFIARSYAFNIAHTKEMIKAAIQHRGLALVDVLQPCPTYNDLHDKDWFDEPVEWEGRTLPRTFRLDETGYDGRVADPADPDEVFSKQKQAFETAQPQPRIPLGVLYQIELPTYFDRLGANAPVLKEFTPFTLPITNGDGTQPLTDLSAAYTEFLV
ncbi:MAG TPA: thiamine pyrophosphate-dependent enzyme [Verrucomicrobiae bacterium]|nr:thiamine pyrophosphate-dependent enzyme [Verrucomicrobiae bacterium]